MTRKFTGCGTALVTPFNEISQVDGRALRRLVDWQIESGIDFLVPCGTTGESPTLSDEEQLLIIRLVVEQAAGRVPVVAGTGSNDLAHALELTWQAKEAGADGCLVVSPYYNKPTQQGLYAYFTAIAELGLPVIVYNIPGRTGVNIMPETMKELARHPNITGIKEATGNLEQMADDILRCGESVTYLSGDDTLTLPLLSLGGHGVISVISNVVPFLTATMVHAARRGQWDEARKVFFALFPLAQAMFLETNPIPVKEAMASLGLLEPVWRLPMTPPEQRTRDIVRERLGALGIRTS